MTDETLQQLSDREISIKILERLDAIEKRLDAHDLQFEAIRKGISENYFVLERVQGDIHYLRADVHKMSEDVRRDKLALK